MAARTKAGKQVAYPFRAFDEAGNEIYPEKITLKFSGGGIDIGHLPCPHKGARVGGSWEGHVRSGNHRDNASVRELVITVSVESADVEERPEPEGGLLNGEQSSTTKKAPRRTGAPRRRRGSKAGPQDPDAIHAFVPVDGAEEMCAVCAGAEGDERHRV